MDLYKTGALVSSSWLARELQDPGHNLRLLDTSWDIRAPKTGKDDFVRKHIPGASFHNLNHCVNPTQLMPRNTPDPGCYTHYMRSLGVCTNSHVVFYDREHMQASARAWFVLRAFGHVNVSVLDGGLVEWEAEGHEVITGETEIPDEGDFSVSICPGLVRDYDDVCDNIMSRAEQLLDSRWTSDFIGGKEPNPGTYHALKGWGLPLPERLLPGHVPGALSLPYTQLFPQDKHHFKDIKHLSKLFTDADVDLERPLVTMCYIGHTACLVALAAAALGKLDVAVYFGSWTEYGQRSDQEFVVTGSER